MFCLIIIGTVLLISKSAAKDADSPIFSVEKFLEFDLSNETAAYLINMGYNDLTRLRNLNFTHLATDGIDEAERAILHKLLEKWPENPPNPPSTEATNTEKPCKLFENILKDLPHDEIADLEDHTCQVLLANGIHDKYTFVFLDEKSIEDLMKRSKVSIGQRGLLIKLWETYKNIAESPAPDPAPTSLPNPVPTPPLKKTATPIQDLTPTPPPDSTSTPLPKQAPTPPPNPTPTPLPKQTTTPAQDLTPTPPPNPTQTPPTNPAPTPPPNPTPTPPPNPTPTPAPEPTNAPDPQPTNAPGLSTTTAKISPLADKSSGTSFRFMVLLLLATVSVLVAYIVYHQRQKIRAMLCGQSPHSEGYKPVATGSNIEEILTHDPPTRKKNAHKEY